MAGTPRFITPWAPDANYPAGANVWNGTPTKVTPAYVEFQPSPAFAPTAQEFNQMFAARDAVINAIGSDAAKGAFVTWQPSYVMSMLGTITPSCAAWDPITLKWLVGGLTATPNVIVGTGRGDPLNWSAAGGGADLSAGNLPPQSVCRGIEPGVSNKYVYTSVVSAGDPAVIRIDTVGLAFSLSLPSGIIADGTQCLVGSVSGAVFATVGATSAGHTGIFHTIDHGATWVAGPAPGVVFSNWLLAQSVPGGGTIMAIPAYAVAGGTNYYTSTDGLTWTTQSGLTGLPLLSTETPSGLTYGADSVGTACWILTTHDSAGGGVTKTYRSYNGTSWASFANNIPVGLILVSLSASGQQLVGAIFEAPLARLLCSLDGGATWATTNLSLVGTAGAATAASPNQFLALGNTLVAASVCYGSPGGIGAP